jgi:hypothetical protein
MMYSNYDEIPKEVRRYILDQSGARRIKQNSLAYCNELAEDYFEYEAECAELKKFALHVVRDGNKIVKTFESCDDVFVAFDQEIDYNIGTLGVTMVITQAGRPMRGYVNGKVINPATIYDGLGHFRG